MSNKDTNKTTFTVNRSRLKKSAREFRGLSVFPNKGAPQSKGDSMDKYLADTAAKDLAVQTAAKEAARKAKEAEDAKKS